MNLRFSQRRKINNKCNNKRKRKERIKRGVMAKSRKVKGINNNL